MTIFVVRQNHKIDYQSIGHTYPADKAELISGISFGNNRCGSVARIGNGFAAFSFLHNSFFSTMRQNSKNLTADARGVSKSTARTRNSTPVISKRELCKLQKSLETERSAKNLAYCFILANNYLNDYAAFAKECKGADSHVLSQSVLISNYIKTKLRKA